MTSPAKQSALLPSDLFLIPRGLETLLISAVPSPGCIWEGVIPVSKLKAWRCPARSLGARWDKGEQF